MNEKNSKLWAEANQLAGRGYSTRISEDVLSSGEKVFLVEHPELDGCMTQGFSLDDALNDLKQVTVDFIYYLLEDGLDVPSPISSQTVTGSSGGHVIGTFEEGITVHFTPVTPSPDEKIEIVSEDTESQPPISSMQFSVIEGELT